MSHKEKVAKSERPRPWTRPEDYLGALAFRRSFRRSREPRPRTEHDRPRMLLSTMPFFVLLMLLGVLAVAIMIVAFPGTQPQIRQPPATAKEKGVAQRGWFEEAQKDMHH